MTLQEPPEWPGQGCAGGSMTMSTSMSPQREIIQLLRMAFIFGRLAVDSSAQQAQETTCITSSTGCLIEAFPWSRTALQPNFKE